MAPLLDAREAWRHGWRSRRGRCRPLASTGSIVAIVAAAALHTVSAWCQVWIATPSLFAGSRARGPVRGGGGLRAGSAAVSQVREQAAPPRTGLNFIPTVDAPFVSPGVQPLSLSPDGLRTARFEVEEVGIVLRVEAAPTFGAEGSGGTAVATAEDVLDRKRVIPRQKLGTTGVLELFWVGDRSFLITGYYLGLEGYYAWFADRRSNEVQVVSLPTRTASLVVPSSPSGSLFTRLDEGGRSEILLCYIDASGEQKNRTWAWYHTPTGDLTDAAPNGELPTELWREVVLSQAGEIEAVLLWNGTVYRRAPGTTWLEVGLLQLAAADGEEAKAAVGASSTDFRQYLISLGADFSVYAIDLVAHGAPAPEIVPPPEHLGLEGTASEDTSSADWVLKECRERETAALVHMVTPDVPPTPLFAHPYVDVTAAGVLVDLERATPEVVVVEGLKPKAYALTPEAWELLDNLREKVPAAVKLDGVTIPATELEPRSFRRHGDHWLVGYWHPSLSEPVVLPALIQGGKVTWMGAEALPAPGGATSAAALKLSPRVEGHWIKPAAGGLEVPIYLILPEADPAALVVVLHTEQEERDSWGADGLDAWLLSRGYGILKINHRGSSGFGRKWLVAEGQSFLDDIVASVRWALDVRCVLGSDGGRAGGAHPPVAIYGWYFGGTAAVRALAQHPELFACGVVVAPTLGGLPELPVLVVEYERDSPESRDQVLDHAAPLGSAPEDWPGSLTFVQYAGESRGGGLVRQNLLDQFRRVDSFLHAHLSPLVEAGELVKEKFIDELPFLSASLLPETDGQVSPTTKDVELGLEKILSRHDARRAEGLPALSSQVSKAGAGFGASDQMLRRGQREALVAPRHRLGVRTDGIVELSVDFPGGAPDDLHVMVSQLHLHIRATGLGFNLALPRRPAEGAQLQAFRLPSGHGFIFELQCDPAVGAVENYQSFQGGGTILSALFPEDLAMAPVVVPS